MTSDLEIARAARLQPIAAIAAGANIPESALVPYGRLVAFGAGGGTVDAGSLLGGLKSVTGFSMGLISRREPERLVAYRAELWDLLHAGRLRPAVTALPLERFGQAVDLIASRRSTGRVLLDTTAAS